MPISPPVAPFAPVAPVAPFAPVAPVAPFAPVAPQCLNFYRELIISL